MIKYSNAKYNLINRNYLQKLECIIDIISIWTSSWRHKIEIDIVPADVVYETGSAGTIGDTD
jgi:hypothetical protein